VPLVKGACEQAEIPTSPASKTAASRIDPSRNLGIGALLRSARVWRIISRDGGVRKGANRAKLDLTGEGIVAPKRALPEAGRAGETPLMEVKACYEYAKEMRSRYRKATRTGRSRLLDEFTAVTGYHRKYAIALLAREPTPRSRPPGRPTRFTDEVVDALRGIWRAADYPWSARLVAMLPTWMPHARVHLNLCDEVEQLLLTMSARSMDRLLRRHRTALKRRIYGRTKPGTLLKHHIPVRTERWDTTEVGWCETDTVAHCGEVGDGEFAFSVNLTDVVSTWTETRVVLGKGQRFVVEALEEMRRTLPFALRGIDSDSGSEFINHHCYSWCKKHELEFTRGRPYRKNDNAYIEQKNWTHVRKIFGWKRIDAPAAIEAMNALYRNELRLLLNYFQPSVKLVERNRIGSRERRKYDRPRTPFERLIELGALSPEQIAAMQAERDRLDPFALSAAIESKVAAILRIPSGPVAKRISPRLLAAIQQPYSPGGAQIHAAQAAALVRSNAAR
jgi:hypothetical protein